MYALSLPVSFRITHFHFPSLRPTIFLSKTKTHVNINFADARCLVPALQSVRASTLAEGQLSPSSGIFGGGACPSCISRRLRASTLDEGCPSLAHPAQPTSEEPRLQSEQWLMKLPDKFDPIERARLIQIARGTAHGLSPSAQISFFERALGACEGSESSQKPQVKMR